MSSKLGRLSVSVVVAVSGLLGSVTLSSCQTQGYSEGYQSPYGSLEALETSKFVFEGTVDKIEDTGNNDIDFDVSNLRIVALSARLEADDVAIVEQALAPAQVTFEGRVAYNLVEGNRYLFFGGLQSGKELGVTSFEYDLDSEESVLDLLKRTRANQAEEVALAAGDITTREFLMTLWNDMQAQRVTGERSALLQIMAGRDDPPKPAEATYVPDLDENSYPATPIDRDPRTACLSGIAGDAPGHRHRRRSRLQLRARREEAARVVRRDQQLRVHRRLHTRW